MEQTAYINWFRISCIDSTTRQKDGLFVGLILIYTNTYPHECGAILLGGLAGHHSPNHFTY